MITQRLVLSLIKVAEVKGDPEIIKALWNTYHCYGENPMQGYPYPANSYGSSYNFGWNTSGSYNYGGHTASYNMSGSYGGYYMTTSNAQSTTFSFGSHYSFSGSVSFQNQYYEWSQSMSYSHSHIRPNGKYLADQPIDQSNQFLKKYGSAPYGDINWGKVIEGSVTTIGGDMGTAGGGVADMALKCDIP